MNLTIAAFINRINNDIQKIIFCFGSTGPCRFMNTNAKHAVKFLSFCRGAVPTRKTLYVSSAGKKIVKEFYRRLRFMAHHHQEVLRAAVPLVVVSLEQNKFCGRSEKRWMKFGYFLSWRSLWSSWVLFPSKVEVEEGPLLPGRVKKRTATKKRIHNPASLFELQIRKLFF